MFDHLQHLVFFLDSNATAALQQLLLNYTSIQRLPVSTLFPYTTLFRSRRAGNLGHTIQIHRVEGGSPDMRALGHQLGDLVLDGPLLVEFGDGLLGVVLVPELRAVSRTADDVADALARLPVGLDDLDHPRVQEGHDSRSMVLRDLRGHSD